MEQNVAPSTRFFEFAPRITNLPNQISVQDRQRTLRLEQISFGTVRMQSHHLQRWRHTGIMGIPRRGRMVLRSIAGPLPMRPVLSSRNKSIKSIGIDRTVPPTLPGPESDRAPTLTSTHRGTGRNYHQRRNYSQRMSTHQEIAGED